MNNNEVGFITVLALTFLAILMLVSHAIGFKSGQVGALSGIRIEYQLVTNANNTVTWVFRK